MRGVHWKRFEEKRLAGHIGHAAEGVPMLEICGGPDLDDGSDGAREDAKWARARLLFGELQHDIGHHMNGGGLDNGQGEMGAS